MGNAPVLKIGDLVLQKSDAITQFLLEKCDALNDLIPKSRNRRAQVQMHMSAADGTLMAHRYVALCQRSKAYPRTKY